MVDVLANDVDPAGGMLVVQRADARTDDQLDVAVVQGRWVRVSARQGSLTPNPQVVRYTISNGLTSGVEGEITVSQRPEVDDNSPVTQVDRVVVRAGAAISVPVLDNDFSPAGDQLRLVNHLAGEGSGHAAHRRSRRHARPAATPARRTCPGAWCATSPRARSTTRPTSRCATSRPTRPARPRPAASRSPSSRPSVATSRPSPRSSRAGPSPATASSCGSPGWASTPTATRSPCSASAPHPSSAGSSASAPTRIEYQAYPGSGGTDEFDYVVVDAGGETATGTARVAVVPGGVPQPPLAVADTVDVAPGRTATVDVMANDLVAGGDRVTVELADAQPGVRLQSETGPILVDAPERADGRTVDVVYRLTNGIDTSQATLTLRSTKDVNNPPVVHDAFGTAEDAEAVTADVLATAYDADGSADDLRVTDVFVPVGVPPAEVVDGRVTVAAGRRADGRAVPGRGRRRRRGDRVALRARGGRQPAVRPRGRRDRGRPGRLARGSAWPTTSSTRRAAPSRSSRPTGCGPRRPTASASGPPGATR